ncbi:hypothetical protein LXL04_020045 [Taraxacum kok-saghyz]
MECRTGPPPPATMAKVAGGGLISPEKRAVYRTPPPAATMATVAGGREGRRSYHYISRNGCRWLLTAEYKVKGTTCNMSLVLLVLSIEKETKQRDAYRGRKGQQRKRERNSDGRRCEKEPGNSTLPERQELPLLMLCRNALSNAGEGVLVAGEMDLYPKFSRSNKRQCWDLLRTHIFPRTRELPQFPISPKPDANGAGIPRYPWGRDPNGAGITRFNGVDASSFPFPALVAFFFTTPPGEKERNASCFMTSDGMRDREREMCDEREKNDSGGVEGCDFLARTGSGDDRLLCNVAHTP